MYDLWIAATIAALIVGVFVWGLIFWCIIRYRKRGDTLPVQTRFNMPMEVLYTVTPVLIVAVLFYYTAIVQTDVDKLSAKPDQTVEVVAFKWNWQFNYRDGVGEDANTVASTLGSTRRHPAAGPPDRVARSGSRRPARTSSTRSGCRRCCSSGTSSRAACATPSR